jgi:glutamyl-tRNA synthetase
MVRLFDIRDVNKSASAFNVEKLSWLNQQHMMRVAPARIVPLLRWQLDREGIRADDEAQLEKIVLSLRERAKTVREMALGSIFFFRPPATYEEKAVRKHLNPEVLALMADAAVALDQLEDWSAPAIHEVISGICAAQGVPLGKLAQPIRIALCGGTVSPPIDATLAILGREESILRLARAQAAWSA